MKKGFTLVELLAVIVVLGVITLVAVPSVITSNKKSKANEYNNFKKTIENAAEIYVETHLNDEKIINLKSQPNSEISIEIIDLISEGLVNGNMIDPDSNEKIINENITVGVKNSSGQLVYKFNKG